jgi:hypothetical protein
VTEKEWKMFEDSAHFVKTMGPTYVGIVDHDVLISAHKELKERREDEEYIRANGYCLTRLEDGWALMCDGSNHSVASRGPTIHAAIAKAKEKSGPTLVQNKSGAE